MKKWLFIPLSLLLIECSQKVVTFTNEDASFASYHTFTLVNYKSHDTQPSGEGKIIFGLIESETSEQMYRRGYERSNISPDILIRYEIISNQVTNVTRNNSYNTPYSYSPFMIRTFLESALLLEMTDLKSKKMIWQASVDMSQYQREDDQTKIIQKAISQLFDTYLFTAGSNKSDETLKQNK